MRSATLSRSQKTQPTPADVDAFLAAVPDERRRADARTLCSLLAEVTGEPPVLCGPSIVGFGSYHYRYASGHEGTSALASFSPGRPTWCCTSSAASRATESCW